MIEILHCKYYTTSGLCLKINVKLSTGDKNHIRTLSIFSGFLRPAVCFSLLCQGSTELYILINYA